MPLDAPLTPLIPRLEAPLHAALRSLLALPPAATLRVAAPANEPTTLRLTLSDPDGPGLTLHLRCGADTNGWSARPDLGLTVERPDVPLQPNQRRRLRALARRFAADTLDGQAVLDAWESWRPYAGAEDRMYRQLSRSSLGVMGTLRFGFRCSQDCHFCWQSRDWPDAPDDLLHTWLDELAAGGAETLSISGGEPTLHRALPDLIQRATTEHGLRVHLQTNAIKLRRLAYVRSLQDAGLGSVMISLHSADPDVSDAMTRAPGTWRRTIEGITVCLEADLFVALNCCVEAANAEGLADLAQLIVDRFVTASPGNPVQIVNLSQPSDYFEPGLWARSVAPFDVVAPGLVAAARTLRDAGVRLNIAGSCGFPVCVFREDLSLVPALLRSALEEQDLLDRPFAPLCQDCAVRPRCPGVRREYLEVHGERGLAALGPADLAALTPAG